MAAPLPPPTLHASPRPPPACLPPPPLQVKVYLADFSQATDVSGLYPRPQGATSPDYLHFDSTAYSELFC